MQEKDYSKGRNAVGGAAPETGRAAAVETTIRKVSMLLKIQLSRTF
jgi:hypothetical protein